MGKGVKRQRYHKWLRKRWQLRAAAAKTKRQRA